MKMMIFVITLPFSSSSQWIREECHFLIETLCWECVWEGLYFRDLSPFSLLFQISFLLLLFLSPIIVLLFLNQNHCTYILIMYRLMAYWLNKRIWICEGLSKIGKMAEQCSGDPSYKYKTQTSDPTRKYRPTQLEKSDPLEKTDPVN